MLRTAGQHLPLNIQTPSPQNHPLKPPSTALTHLLRVRLEPRAHSRPSRPYLLLTNHQDTQGLCAVGDVTGEAPSPPGMLRPTTCRGPTPFFPSSLRLHRVQLPREDGGQRAPSNRGHGGGGRGLWAGGGKPHMSGMSPASPSTRLGNRPNRLLSPRPGQAGGEARARVAEANSSRGGGLPPLLRGLAPPSPASIAPPALPTALRPHSGPFKLLHAGSLSAPQPPPPVPSQPALPAPHRRPRRPRAVSLPHRPPPPPRSPARVH